MSKLPPRYPKLQQHQNNTPVNNLHEEETRLQSLEDEALDDKYVNAISKLCFMKENELFDNEEMRNFSSA